MKTSFKTPLKTMYAVAIILFATISGCKKDDATPTNGTIDAEVQATADDKSLAEETENGNTTMNDYAKDIDPSSAGGRTEGT